MSSGAGAGAGDATATSALAMVAGQPLRAAVSGWTMNSLSSIAALSAELLASHVATPSELPAELLRRVNELLSSPPSEALSHQFESLLALARLFCVDVDRGTIVFPETMTKRMEDSGKDMTEWRTQSITIVENLYSGAGMVFNPIRAKRPGGTVKSDLSALMEFIAKKKGDDCDFCNPKLFTAEAPWGRIESEYCITTSNMAAFCGNHGLIVAREHNPLEFTEAQHVDMMRVAQEWFKRSAAAAEDPDGWCPQICFDALPKGGASQLHTHFHVSMFRNRYLAFTAKSRSAAKRYAQSHAGRNYWWDKVLAHDVLGLVVRVGEAVAYPSLTPQVGVEIVIVAPSMSTDLAKMLYAVRRAMMDALGTRAFSCGGALPQMGGDDLDMPVVLNILDRGAANDPRADVSSNELYGSPVISKDPFAVARAIARCIKPLE